MTAKPPKRPRDLNQWAKHMVDVATGQAQDNLPDEGKNPAAVALGRLDPKHISTSFAERNHLNIRMHSRRMTRLTNAFSKKLDNHRHAMALHFLYYNFVKVHQTLKISPAMAAGITKRLWEMSDVVAMLETWETVQAKLSAA